MPHWTCLMVELDLSSLRTGLQRPLTGFKRPSPNLSAGADLSRLGPTSKNFLPAFREVHRTCPVKDSFNCSFEVGAINRPPPTPLGRWPLRETRILFEIQKLELLPLSLSLRLQSSFLILERRFELPLVCHLQARAPHSLPRLSYCVCYS
jgi:hypothetical protein